MNFIKKEERDRKAKTPGKAVGGRLRRQKTAVGEEHVYGNEEDDVQVRLQMYRDPPTETIGLMNFEELTLERLKILKAVERAGVTHIRGSEQYQKLIDDELTKINKAYTTCRREDYRETVRNDIISHYLLRLAYCRTEDLRRWFIATECDYFRYRFVKEMQASDKLKKFLEVNKLKMDEVKDEEKRDIFGLLKAAAPPGQSQTTDTSYYKVPFTSVLDLVRRRTVFLKDGYAYVSQNDLASIIIGSHFRPNLSLLLTKASRMVHLIDEDPRLKPILVNLPKRHLGKRYDEKSGALDNLRASMIPSLNQSFPPCMQKLYGSLRENHHLKHHGRQQYWNFLKGIGMPMEETINHLREEFIKIMDPDKFDKEHRYNIRHSYGQEGKKTNYTPFSCIKIITANPPGPGDTHGCPFKHTDPSLLRQRLTSGQNRVTDSAAKTIVDFAKDNHFQVACSCYYEAVHGIEIKTSGMAINHPNQYFKESQMHLHPERFDKKPVVEIKSEPVIKSEPRVEIKAEPKQSVEADTFTQEELMEMEDDM